MRNENVKAPNPYTGSVRLVDRKTRVVEVLGPEPLGSKTPTDRKLLLWDRSGQDEYMRGPMPVALCFAADGRTAKFLVDRNIHGDRLLDMLSKHPHAPSRLAKPYGIKGWLVEG